MIAVPPVLPQLRTDLHLSFSAAGALTAIPALCLGVAAIPGAVLISRFGARTIVGVAALALGFSALLRLTPPLPYSLFFWTAIFSLAIGAAQPAIAVLVRSWFPQRIQQVSTFYVLSLSVGGLSGGTLSVYLLRIGGWRGTFAIWALLALLAAGIWVMLAPDRRAHHEPIPHGIGGLLGNRHVWHVAALFACVNLVFFGSATWMPFLVSGRGHNYLALILFLFQVVSLPLTAILAVIPWHWSSSRVWYATGGSLMTAGTLVLMSGMIDLAWFAALVVGLGCTMVFAGASALPAILARTPAEVAGYTALMLAAGNGFGFFGPFLGGVLLDYTHIITAPFWVIAVAASTAVALGVTLSTTHPPIERAIEPWY
jgi:CP family cyanate transporter-like MFS transporter